MCLESMKIFAFIENEEIISKILKHLGLWGLKQRPPPRANAPSPNIHIDYTARPGAADVSSWAVILLTFELPIHLKLTAYLSSH